MNPSVFRYRLANHDDEFYWIGVYHKKHFARYGDGAGRTNPRHDDFSRRILGIKDGDQLAVEFFFRILNGLIANDVAIAVVPGHSPGSVSSGMEMLVKKLAMNNRKSALGLLERHSAIQKLSHGGNRSIKVHHESIAIRRSLSVSKGVGILLLDDVLTTGNSLRACKSILSREGFVDVTCLALGKTAVE